jgi:hypothetical protein
MNFSKLSGFGKVLAVALVITLVFFAGVITERYIINSPRLGKFETVSEFGGMECASYVIFKEGSTYYAKNGKTGNIEARAQKLVPTSFGPSVAVVNNEIFVWGTGVANISYIYNQVSNDSLLSKESGVDKYVLKTGLIMNGTSVNLHLEITDADCEVLYFSKNNTLGTNAKLLVVGGYVSRAHIINGTRFICNGTTVNQQIYFGYLSAGSGLNCTNAYFEGFNANYEAVFLRWLHYSGLYVEDTVFNDTRVTSRTEGAEWNNCTFIDGTAQICIAYVADTYIHHSTFKETTAANPVYVTWGCDDVVIDFCNFYNVSDGTYEDAIFFRPIVNATVKNSVFDNTCWNRGYDAIQWGDDELGDDNNSKHYIQNLTVKHYHYGVVGMMANGYIKDCVFEDMELDPISIGGINILIDNNEMRTYDKCYISRRTLAGVFHSFSHNITISNNLFFNATTGGDAWYIGLMLNGVEDITITGNNFSHFGNAGIVLNPNSTDVYIYDNNFYGAPWNWLERNWFNPTGYDPFGKGESADRLRTGIWIWGYSSYWWDYDEAGKNEIPSSTDYEHYTITGNRFDGTYLIAYTHIFVCPSNEVSWSNNTISNGDLMHVKSEVRYGELSGEVGNLEFYANPQNPVYGYVYSLNRTAQWDMKLNSSAWVFKERWASSSQFSITINLPSLFDDPLVSLQVPKNEYHGWGLVEDATNEYLGIQCENNDLIIHSYKGDSKNNARAIDNGSM